MTRPTDLQLVGDSARLQITWSDGANLEYAVQDLRDACPCATCREKRTQPSSESAGLPILALEETQPVRIAAMQPVGNYAYTIRFSDGHDTGIYTFEFLRQAGQPPKTATDSTETPP